jgi:hypothetical protein
VRVSMKKSCNGIALPFTVVRVMRPRTDDGMYSILKEGPYSRHFGDDNTQCPG